MDLSSSLIISFLGGFLPVIIWLFFWLQEDKAHPEPNRLIILSFWYGMLAVPAVLIVQIIGYFFFISDPDSSSIFVIALWASIEEIFKFVAAYKGGISKKENNEPMDPVIYTITAALGFAALENMLFLFNPLFQGETVTAFITGNMRFVGATLLHASASALIGICIAFSYYKNKKIQKQFLIVGFILAIGLHTIFNYFIIHTQEFTLLSFVVVWIVIISIILLLEKVKKIFKNN